MHFWVFAARVYERRSVPRKMGLNWFIPALVNSSVGSSCGTTGDDGTNVWPCRCTKKSMNCWRIRAEVIGVVVPFVELVVKLMAGHFLVQSRPPRANAQAPDYSRTGR